MPRTPLPLPATPTDNQFLVTAIEPTTGIHIIECGVIANSEREAEAAYLAGNFMFPTIVGDRNIGDVFTNDDPAEYIIGIRKWDGFWDAR